MADRTVYGNAVSENGWRMVDQGSCVWVKVPGTGVSLQIREGQPAAIMGAFASDFSADVEPLRDADSACWTATNSVASSNHLSGTAMDLNWNSHPFRIADAGFDAGKLAAVRELLAFYEDMIFWGNDWDSPKDAMHFQMGYDTYGAENVDRVQDFINRKIRADGFSTFRRGGTVTPPPPPPPPASDAVDVLARAADLPIAKAQSIVLGVINGLRDSDCTNANRIAMWLAQIGHESAGFNATEEYASGAAYEGRRDLGNTQPGDGVRFKGRTWIQITGRSNYTALSQWAYSKGIVPSASYFVDDSTRLADMQYAGLGPAWYWTVARPQINSLCDARNLTAVTQAINGGQTGAPERRSRYDRALALGDQLLTLTQQSAPQDELEELFMANPAVPSLSIYANPGEPAVPVLTMIAAQDAHGPHEPYVEKLARLGDTDSLVRVARTAAGRGTYGTAAFAVNQAANVLAEVEAAHPEYIRAALAAQKGA